jgi:uncharacterized protein (DUF169 family)
MEDGLAVQLRALDEAIGRYVRPDTFPVAIRMLAPGEPIPEGLRSPNESSGERWIVCQSIGIARRYGWGVAVGRDDVICPLASVAFGFRRPVDEYLKGYAAIGMYCETETAAADMEAEAWKFPYGRWERLAVVPVARATFEPHVIAVYGNSAQVMRLVNAALFRSGARIHSTSAGRLDCAEIVIQTMTTDQPKVVLPCNGDRVFGMAQDTEMAFAFPWRLASEIVGGLEGTHRGGVRYPIPVAMRQTVVMPDRYRQLLAMLESNDQLA